MLTIKVKVSKSASRKRLSTERYFIYRMKIKSKYGGKSQYYVGYSSESLDKLLGRHLSNQGRDINDALYHARKVTLTFIGSTDSLLVSTLRRNWHIRKCAKKHSMINIQHAMFL